MCRILFLNSFRCLFFVFTTILSSLFFWHRPKMNLQFQSHLCISDLSCNWNKIRRKLQAKCTQVCRLHGHFPRTQQYLGLLCCGYDSSFPALETEAGTFCLLVNRRKAFLNGNVLRGSGLPMDGFELREILCAMITFFIWRRFLKHKQVWNFESACQDSPHKHFSDSLPITYCFLQIISSLAAAAAPLVLTYCGPEKMGHRVVELECAGGCHCFFRFLLMASLCFPVVEDSQ